MLRKSVIVFSTSNSHCLHCFCGPSTVPSTSLNSAHPSSGSSNSSLSARTSRRLPRHSYRHYAIISDGNVRSHQKILPWPEVTKSNSVPTPYQIFNQRKGSPYSKQRFFELVKLYHPDRHGIDDLGISFATKLERYRLVVAANDILSDPIKRGAYDTYGAGWNGMPDVLHPRDVDEQHRPRTTYSGRGWAGDSRGPSQNATWEDWEKWYHEQSGTKMKQSPLYVSNSAFVALIVIFAALGGVGQSMRVDNISTNYLDRRNALHVSVSKDLIETKNSVKYFDHDVCVENFLKRRDPYESAASDPINEQYRKLLLVPDICCSEFIKRRALNGPNELDSTAKVSGKSS